MHPHFVVLVLPISVNTQINFNIQGELINNATVLANLALLACQYPNSPHFHHGVGKGREERIWTGSIQTHVCTATADAALQQCSVGREDALVLAHALVVLGVEDGRCVWIHGNGRRKVRGFAFLLQLVHIAVVQRWIRVSMSREVVDPLVH